METKSSKIFGIPTALIFFVLGLSIFIDGFIYWFIYTPLSSQIVKSTQLEIQATQVKKPIVSVVPSATPSATATPIKSVKSSQVQSSVNRVITITPTK